MTISYPLEFPDNNDVLRLSMRTPNAAALSGSPFTFKQQVVAYPGQLWEFDLSLRPMKRSTAEAWLAWLVSLKGYIGRFNLGDPRACVPRGTMAGETRRNRLLFSEQFDNAEWAPSSGGTGSNPIVTPNTITDPLAGSTADSVLFDAGAGGTDSDFSTLDGEDLNAVVGDSYIGSIHIKSASGGETMQMRHVGKSAYKTINVTNTWQRISKVEVATGIFAPLRMRFSGTAGATATIHLWGAQLEAGRTLSAYQAIAAALGPVVNGASQTGSQLVLDGAGVSETGWAKAGDYIQLGTGSQAHLHKVLADADSDASGNVTLDIWPNLREPPADNDPVIVDNAQGLFRLASNMTAWDINANATYGITFPVIEALV